MTDTSREKFRAVFIQFNRISHVSLYSMSWRKRSTALQIQLILHAYSIRHEQFYFQNLNEKQVIFIYRYSQNLLSELDGAWKKTFSS